MAQRTRGDEFYTTRSHVELILDKYLKNYNFTSKVIYCPCDSEKSNFVKVLQERKDLLKYKELIYTSDDFRKHKEIFKKADLVITNPPFSLGAAFQRYCSFSKDYFFLTSMFSIKNVYILGGFPYFVSPTLGGDRSVEYKFETPEGTFEGVPIIYAISKNLSEIVPYEKQDLFQHDETVPNEFVYYAGNLIPKFKRFRQIPQNFEGIFQGPFCCLFLQRLHNFDIIETKSSGPILKLKNSSAKYAKTHKLF